MRSTWYSRLIRTTAALRLNGTHDTGYVVRTILRINKGTKAVTGREVELHLTAAEARELAAELIVRAEYAEQTNRIAGYLIDLPRD